MAFLLGGLMTPIDSIIGLIFNIIGFESIVLNTLIIIYLQRRNKTPTNLLFKLLAINDALTSLLCSFIFGYLVLIPEDVPGNTSTLNKTATTIHVIHYSVYILLVYMSCYITPTAMLVKFAAIRYPFKRVKRFHVVIVLVIMATPHIASIIGLAIFYPQHIWSWCMKIILIARRSGNVRIFITFCRSLICFVQIANIVMSIYVVSYLRRHYYVNVLQQTKH